MGWNNNGSIFQFNSKNTLKLIEQIVDFYKKNIEVERELAIGHDVKWQTKNGKRFFFYTYGQYTPEELKELREETKRKKSYMDSWGDDAFSRIKYRQEHIIEKLTEIYESIKGSTVNSKKSIKLWLDKDDANLLSSFVVKEFMSDRYADFVKNKGKINGSLSNDFKTAFDSD